MSLTQLLMNSFTKLDRIIFRCIFTLCAVITLTGIGLCMEMKFSAGLFAITAGVGVFLVSLYAFYDLRGVDVSNPLHEKSERVQKTVNQDVLAHYRHMYNTRAGIVPDEQAPYPHEVQRELNDDMNQQELPFEQPSVDKSEEPYDSMVKGTVIVVGAETVILFVQGHNETLPRSAFPDVVLEGDTFQLIPSEFLLFAEGMSAIDRARLEALENYMKKEHDHEHMYGQVISTVAPLQ